MLTRSRVLWWCLLAGCAGGPTTDFPVVGSGGSEPPKGPGPADHESPPPPDEPEDDGARGDGDGEFEGDLGASGDAGALPTLPDRPCGPTDQDAGVPDGGVVITYDQLVMSAVPGGACTSLQELDLVCDGAIQASVGRCNEQSLSDSAGFGLVKDCVLGDPKVDGASDACVDCYLSANQCTLLNCLAACLVPVSSTACNQCRIDNCGAAFSTCSGLPAF
ncbi:MAG: hypothetical protein QM778_19140 [Myxococcales bacterium]